MTSNPETPSDEAIDAIKLKMTTKRFYISRLLGET